MSLIQEVITSDTEAPIKQSTAELLLEWDKIVDSLEWDKKEKAKKEREDVRLATIWALSELKLTTSHNLQDFQDELKSVDGNGEWSEIKKEEFENVIQKEWEELREFAQKETQEERNERYSEYLDNAFNQAWSDEKKFRDTLSWEQWFNEWYHEDEGIIAILKYFENHPQHAKTYVENGFNITSVCILEYVPIVEELNAQIRESYFTLETKRVSQNIVTLFTDSWVSPEIIANFEFEISDLVLQMQEGSCSIDYLTMLQDFSDEHFSQYKIEIDGTQALSVIWDVIELKKTDTELQLMNLRDRISNISWESYEKVAKLLETWDISDIEKYLGNEQLFSNQEEAQTLLEEVEDLLWVKEEIQEQEERLSDLQKIANEWGLGFVLELLKDKSNPQDKRKIIDLLSPPKHSELQNNLPDLLYSITDLNTIRSLYAGSHMEPLKSWFDLVTLSDIHPSLRIHAAVIRWFPWEIWVEDLASIPTEYFHNEHLGINNIKYLLTRNNILDSSEFIQHVLLKAYYSDRRKTVNIVRAITETLSSINPEEKTILKSSIPKVLVTEKNRSTLWLSDEVSLNTWISEQEFDALINKSRKLSLTDVEFEQIDTYLANQPLTEENWTIGTIRGLANKGLFNKLPHMQHALGNRVQSTENGVWDTSPITELQIHILNTDITNLRFFSKEVRTAPDIIEGALSHISGLKEAQYVISQLHFENAASFRAILKGLDQVFGEETADTYLAMDKRFPKLIKMVDNASLHDLSERIWNILLKMKDGVAAFQKSQDIINKVEKSELKWRISNILISLSVSEQVVDQESQTILEIYNKADPSPQDYQKLMEIFGSQEKVKNFLDAVINLKLEEVEQEQIKVLSEEKEKSQYAPQVQKYLRETQEGTHTLDREKILSLFYVMKSEIQLDPEQWDAEFLKQSQEKLEKMWFTPEQAEEIVNDIFTAQLKKEKLVYRKTHMDNYIEAIQNGTLDELDTKAFKSYTEESALQTAKNNESNDSEENPQIKNPSKNENGTYTIKIGEDIINDITPEEFIVINQNQESLKNFVNFRTTLKELNLENIWPFRHDILIAIGSLDCNPNNGDYITGNELSIFLARITYATLWPDMVPEFKNTPESLKRTKQIIRRVNQVGILKGANDVSGVWEGWWIIESAFRKKFAPKDTWTIGFYTSTFKKALKA